MRLNPKYSNLSEKEKIIKTQNWSNNFDINNMSKMDLIILGQELSEEVWNTVRYNIRHLFVKKALIDHTIFAIMPNDEYEKITKNYIDSLDNAL